MFSIAELSLGIHLSLKFSRIRIPTSSRPVVIAFVSFESSREAERAREEMDGTFFLSLSLFFPPFLPLAKAESFSLLSFVLSFKQASSSALNV